MPSAWSQFWNRPCGPADVLRLAVPLVISTISWTIMNFIDRMFLLWYSVPSMAAALPAGMVHFAVLCFPLGVASYVNTFVAQYHGAGRPERIGHAVWQAIRFGAISTPLLLATIPLAPYLFALAAHDPEIVSLEVLYFQVLAYGAGATVLAAALSAFFTGRGKTGVVMLVDSFGALVNIALDYAWIFGHWGFPELGIEGAAWATVVALWAKVAIYFAVMLAPRNRQTFGLVSGRAFDAALFKRLLRYGGPNGLQLFVEICAFTLFVLFIGRLGRDAMAATTIAFNVNGMAFVPMLGMGMAVATMVGQQLGRNRSDLASRATWTGLQIALLYTGIMALLYFAVPGLFLFGHAQGASGDFSRLRETTILLLRFVGAYCLFDAVAIIFASAIKGAGDTRFILWTTLIVSPIPVALVWAGTAHFGGGLFFCWYVLTGWVCVLALAYLARFLQGHWRAMRVIEPGALPPVEAADTAGIACGAAVE